MRKVKVSATQMKSTGTVEGNIALGEELVRLAVTRDGANIILLQELFETNYFCQKPKECYIKQATTVAENKAIRHFTDLSKELNVVLPISFYERHNNAYYNTIAVIDCGNFLGIYRKTHIPDGTGYQEKFYFNPGDTGFKVWDTTYGKIGVGICWDQWFPETARALALQGAELLFFPTAIGSEPQDASLDSRDHWQICMQGHSAANLMPVIASNRIGRENEDEFDITFYGSSFITDNHGKKIAEADRETQTVLTAEFDLDELAYARRCWGVFRDRRPDQYKVLLTMDGTTK
jgi:N-carbamoylputrescine amidase